MPERIFDEQRRAWIAAHAGIFLFQKRRAELLGKRLRAQTRAHTGARPDPHDDQVTPPLLTRTSSTTTGGLETAIAAAAAFAAPLGWPVGRLLYEWIARHLIPAKLRAYPIAALIYSAVVCGAPLLFIDPAHSLWSSFLVPWMAAQLPATFLTAGIYGILEGWLAVDGSSQWWPMTPTTPDIDDVLLLGPMESTMPTLLDPAPTQGRQPPLIARKSPPNIRWGPLVVGIVLAAAGTIWFAVQVLDATLGSGAGQVLNHNERQHLDTSAS